MKCFSVKRAVILCCIAFLCSAVVGVRATADEKELVLWECGQNVPTAPYWKAHAEELEAMLPFDGVMLKIEYPVTEDGTMKVNWKKNVGWMVFRKEVVTEEMVRPFVDAMKAANLKKLKKNLVGVCPYPNPHIMNWFDDAWWAQICDNIRIVARAAKDAGCAGIVFDPEQYGPRTRLWNWRSLVASTMQKQSYAEYDAKVRERGRAFGKALSEGFPDCTILFFHGYSIIPIRGKQLVMDGLARSLEDSDYALYAPWLDGMLEGTSDGTIFVDGCESSYGFREASQFEEGRWDILFAPLAVTRVPDLFRKKTRCGFGLWIDYTRDDYLWHADNPDLNYWSPGRLQHAINLAYQYGDGYVWLWNEKSNWYVDGPDGKAHPPVVQQAKARGMDQRYRDAVADAKIWPGRDTSRLARPEQLEPKTLGFIDRDDLDRLLRRTKKVADLPAEGWVFMPDKGDVGVSQQWFLPETDVTGVEAHSRWRVLGAPGV